jgi:L-amino acid N-acyltransferase YncA
MQTGFHTVATDIEVRPFRDEDWIFPENVASVELHQRCGFRVVGTRERIGQFDGIWRDVLLMERRKP